MKNQKITALQDFIRTNGWEHGGYQKILIMNDGECICVKCAKSEYRIISDSTRKYYKDGWQVAGVDIHWEGDSIFCAHCNVEIESSYGVTEQ
jgi:hypothetical protein